MSSASFSSLETRVDGAERDWKELETELNKFQTNHKDYVKKLEEVESMKHNYLQQFQRLKKKLHGLNSSLDKLEDIADKEKEDEPAVDHTLDSDSNNNHNSVNHESGTEETGLKPKLSSTGMIKKLKGKVSENLSYMSHISDTFPRPNNLYLKVIIGSVCVSILNKEEKWNYKEEYEKFKFVITIISMCCSFLLLFFKTYRLFDALFNFLLVWYYCTLTIRESILVVNGSRIKGWWQAHHFITTVCTAILLIWPDSESYHSFRPTFIWFSFYLSIVQLLQYYYQKGSLYRLRALGEKEEMDTTIEGFQSWMLRGLSFLLPFLFFGYFWELYNAYFLFQLALSTGFQEWPVVALSFIFFILFLGNFITTYGVIRSKFRAGINKNIDWLKFKYYDWKKLKTPSEKRVKKN